MSVVIKVEFEKELRRVSVESAISFACLKQKLANMFSFPDVGSFVVSSWDNDSLERIESDEDCNQAMLEAAQKNPAVLRLLLEEVEKVAKAGRPSCSNCTFNRSDTLYFKCLNCLSYELCASCAAKGCHSEHMLVKLHQPLDSLSYQQQLVFLKHVINPAERLLAKARLQELQEERERVKERKSPDTVDPSTVVPVERNMNVSLLMSEFQEVSTESCKLLEPTVEKEIATWDSNAVIVPEAKEEPTQPTEEALPAAEDYEPATLGEESKQCETDKPHPFKANLEALEQMGFTDQEKNIRLLVKHVNDLEAAVEELLYTRSWFFPKALSQFGL